MSCEVCVWLLLYHCVRRIMSHSMYQCITLVDRLWMCPVCVWVNCVCCYMSVCLSVCQAACVTFVSATVDSSAASRMWSPSTDPNNNSTRSTHSLSLCLCLCLSVSVSLCVCVCLFICLFVYTFGVNSWHKWQNSPANSLVCRIPHFRVTALNLKCQGIFHLWGKCQQIGFL